MPYDIKSPFMSGLLQGEKVALDRIVPLALKAEDLRIDRERNDLLFKLREATLEQEKQETSRKIAEEKMKLAISTGQQELIKGMEAAPEGGLSDLQRFYGIDKWPRITKDVSTGPYGGEPVETDELEMPMSAEDKLLITQAAQDERARRREETMMRGQDMALKRTLAAIAASRDKATGKEDKISITDIKNAYTMEMTGVKNRMLVDMTPEEQMNFANMAPEQLMAALMSGGGKTLTPEKKKQYLGEIQEVENRYGGMIQERLGKGGLKPKATAGAMNKMPDPAAHKGRTIRDTLTSKRYRSNGTKWVEITK